MLAEPFWEMAETAELVPTELLTATAMFPVSMFGANAFICVGLM
jgi:hypothetical protein